MKFAIFAIRTIAVAWLASMSFCTSVFAAPDEQFIPVPVFKTGPISSIGSSIAGGLIDYFDLVNKRDGGVGGVKLVWEECETAFQVDRIVECYERLKKKGPAGAPFFTSYSTSAVYALSERTRDDKIPMAHVNTGRTDAADGRVFPYVFPLGANLWSGSTSKIRFIGGREGGMDKLKGKKIVNLWLSTGFGKESIPILDIQSKMYGFEVTHIEVTLPGVEQQAQWLRVRQIKPDWVIMRLTGASVSAALKMAQRVGYPADHIVGFYGASGEEDVIPAGDAAKGLIAWAFAPSGVDFPVIQDIRKFLYGGGKRGNMEDPKRIGTVNYNAGVVNGIIHVEAMRVAQAKFGKRPLSGEEVRWGFEHLNLDDKRMTQLGAFGLVPNIKVSCADHEGGGGAKFHQWDGGKWVSITGWIPSDQSLVRPMVEEAAAKYAKEKGVTPRDCSKES